jgi:hypothetical protein
MRGCLLSWHFRRLAEDTPRMVQEEADFGAVCKLADRPLV